MKILVANDDGVHFQGLWTLVQVLAPFHQITVVAPDREQSGVGAAISLHRILRARPITPPVSGVSAYAVEGTPGDCVILGLSAIAPDTELVITGINEGSNVGDDIFISGTVGGALHAYFRGVPAIAASVSSPRSTHYRPAAHIVAGLAQALADGQLPRRLLLNVNVPDLPAAEIKGITLTRQARRPYTDVAEEKTDSRGKTYYWLVRRRPEFEVEEGTDIWALRNGLVSILSMQSDVRSTGDQSKLPMLCDVLMQGLRHSE